MRAPRPNYLILLTFAWKGLCFLATNVHGGRQCEMLVRPVIRSGLLRSRHGSGRRFSSKLKRGGEPRPRFLPEQMRSASSSSGASMPNSGRGGWGNQVEAEAA